MPSAARMEPLAGTMEGFQPFDEVSSGGFADGSVAYFLNGKLNACHNAVDRHLPERKDQVAILWEGDEPGATRSVTYEELLADVCRIANALKAKIEGCEFTFEFVAEKFSACSATTLSRWSSGTPLTNLS